MARVLYALSGQGRGHTSRGQAVAAGLRARGHTVTFCGGGTARSVLEAAGETVIPAPTLRQIMRWNRLLLLTTGARNARTVLEGARTVRRLERALEDAHIDLVVSDFDAFAHRAADRLGLPVVTVDHQQVVTETRPDPPVVDPFSRFVASNAVRRIVARRPVRRLISTFFRPPLRDPSRATFVGPILRPEIRALEVEFGDHVLVYVNGSVRASRVRRVLEGVDARFAVYGLEGESTARVAFRQPSRAGFLRDLATCRAVVCTAGFTLLSEAISLGKPILAVPNGGIYEQALNAAFLERQGRGHAARRLTPDVVARVLEVARPLAAPDIEDGLPPVLDAIDEALRR